MTKLDRREVELEYVRRRLRALCKRLSSKTIAELLACNDTLRLEAAAQWLEEEELRLKKAVGI
jgi:hypothetical protein